MYKQYSIQSGKFYPTNGTIKQLESGYYTSKVDGQGHLYFKKQNVSSDEILDFDDSEFDKITSSIDTFWGKKKIFKQWGYLHKRGILLHGPAGSGKTCLVTRLSRNLIDKKDGIVLLGNETAPETLIEAIKALREIEPERPIICIFEDIDAYIKRYDEPEVLSVLDGEANVDNCLMIATTNYPETLDKRITQRPRRFDEVIYIGLPNTELRKQYVEKKLKLTDDEEIETWVKKSEGLSFASLTELCIAVKCLDQDFDAVLRRLHDNASSNLNSESYDKQLNRRFGFSNQ